MNLQVNIPQCKEFAKNFKKCEFLYDKFNNPKHFPPSDADKKETANFFFFITAIDHRTHPKEGHFEGIVEGELFHGADLLWALARKKQRENKDLLTPEYLQNVTELDIKQWFSVEKPTKKIIKNPQSRVVLLKDCAKKLLRFYDGDTNNIIKKSHGYIIKKEGQDRGLLNLLKDFKAYEDPLNKKSYLLMKFLERRGILSIRDPENINIPVDNILIRVSLRSGILDVLDNDLKIRLKKNLPINKKEEFEIRKTTLECFKKISSYMKLSPFLVDDILWEFGRCSCRKDKPLCTTQINENFCQAFRLLKNKQANNCVFYNGCKGGSLISKYRLYKEPNYKTWYY